MIPPFALKKDKKSVGPMQVKISSKGYKALLLHMRSTHKQKTLYPSGPKIEDKK